MRFLLITKDYPPNPDTSGKIVEQLCQEIIKRGNCVDIITRGLVSKEIRKGSYEENVFYVKPTYWDILITKKAGGKNGKLFYIYYSFVKYFRKLLLAFQLARFPNSEYRVTKRIYGLIQDIIKQTGGYDCIIAFFRPFSNLDCLSLIKQSSIRCTTIAYYLDLVEERLDCPSFMPFTVYSRLLVKGDEKVFSNSNYVILPVSAKKNTNQLYIKYSDKIQYCEFPTFIPPQHPSLDSDVNNQSDLIVLVYAGTINKEYRNPLGVIKALNLLSYKYKTKTIVLKIYGRSDCYELIDSIKVNDSFAVEQYGMISKKEVEKEYQRADFIVNIMNSYNSIVPSKIFELFAWGKPIINFSLGNDDGSLLYFEKYPLQITIDCTATGNGKADEIDSLFSFIESNLGKQIDFREVSTLFSECTPKYVAEKILSLVKYE